MASWQMVCYWSSMLIEGQKLSARVSETKEVEGSQRRESSSSSRPATNGRLQSEAVPSSRR